MPQPKRRVRTWTYSEASRSVPYVRVILGSLRESYIAAWHEFRLSRQEPDCLGHREERRRHCEEGVVDLEELARLGVFAYDTPLRGIALFPVVIHEGGSPRDAYFVYKDSRNEIESFVFNDDLCEHYDLLGWERPVPAAWKAGVPVLNLEVKP